MRLPPLRHLSPLLLLLPSGGLACADDTGSGAVHHGQPEVPVDTAAVTHDSGEGADGPCPAEMALVESFCIDRYEAHLEEQGGTGGGWTLASPYQTVDGRVVRAASAAGQVPQGYISAEEAETACQAAGKRLCTSPEWLRACQGTQGWTWPYGNTYQEGACNDDYAGSHPVVDYFGTSEGVWDGEHMNDPGINQQPGTVASSGSFSACESVWGVFDLHGNLHEWVADQEGIFRGGFYADAAINGAGCGYATEAHPRSYHDYSTGFRCCRDAAPRAG